MVSVQVIRDLVSSYIGGAISASDLANSFPPVFISARKSADDAVKKFAYKVREPLAHYSNGFLSEEQLRQALLPIVTEVIQQLATVSMSIAAPQTNSFNRQNSALILEDLQLAIA